MKQHLKAFLVVAVIGALGVWTYVHFMNARLTETPPSIASVEQMEKEGVPNFTYKDLSGQTHDLASLKGKIVILNFWASWCAPCIEEVPSLIKLIKEFKGEVQLIAVSGDSNREDIEVFLKSFPELKGENVSIVYDEDRAVMKRFDISRLPESLVLDKDHKLAKKLVGSIDWYTKDSLAYMKTLLEKP
jgi:thiol-disulfide isomerase/thioredoxin